MESERRSSNARNNQMPNQNRGSFEFHYDSSVGGMMNNTFNREFNDKPMRSNRNQRLPCGSMSNASTTTTNFGQQSFETEKVVVTHIKNPTHFYVNRGAFVSKREAIQKRCQEEALTAIKPIEIKLNKIYLVYSSQQIWQRAKTIAKEKENYRVFFIDYGNEELVLNNK